MDAWADAFKFSHIDAKKDAPKNTGSDGVKTVTAVGGRVFRRVQFKPFAPEERQYRKAIVAELDGVRVYILNEGNNIIVTKDKLM